MKKSVDICFCMLYYMSCVEGTTKKSSAKDTEKGVNTSRGVAQFG